MRLRLLLITVSLLTCTFHVATAGTPAVSVQQAIEQQLQSLDHTVSTETIDTSPIAGVFTVTLKSGQILYVSSDGKHVIQGDMLAIQNGQVTNLTEDMRRQMVAQQLKKLTRKDMIIFSPQGPVKGIVYAFTDVDCGYCRKLHQEVAAMNALGIELRYLAFPRAGTQSPAYHKMVSAWCADDQQAAMTALKQGQTIPSQTCANPVTAHYQLGMTLGVTGTPALFLADGRSVPGYRSAEALAQLLGIPLEKDKLAGNAATGG